MTPSTLTAETAVPLRQFLPASIKLTDWDSIKPYFDNLTARDINSVAALEQWLRDVSELESFIEENSRWRYIHSSINTMDKEAEQALEYFYSEINPKLSPATFELNKKLVSNPYLEQLDQAKYFVYLRGVRKQIDLYREENIELYKELNIKQNEYGALIGKMTIEHNGKTLTMAHAANLLKERNRAVREEVFNKISHRRLEDVEALNKLFNELLALRNKIAGNAGFANFRDYMFAALGRFDYTTEDCFKFHEAIATEVTPLVTELLAERQAALKVDSLRPWDLEVDVEDAEPLNPFDGGEDLAKKSIKCLDQLDPFFSQCVKTMDQMGRLDLDARVGKAPGGYNMSLPETGVPFIFMNAAGSDRDVKTMVHEGGHAVHSFLSHSLELEGFKNYPSEVAELASMSMELFTMEHWDVFYPEKEQLVRSQKNQLEGIIKILPWIATVDKFQHWIYLHPSQTDAERQAAWVKIYNEFHQGVDWSGNEELKANLWQKQLHIFEVPFYYIEYGMAQLGAVAMYKQYKENPTAALENYKKALALGYTKTIGEIFKTAGISFRFDKEYIKELVQFLRDEYGKL